MSRAMNDRPQGRDKSQRPRPKTPTGHRPNNLGDPHVERVLSIALAIATEVSAQHQKIDTIVRVAAAKGLFDAREIEDYSAPPEVEAEWAAWRKAYLERLLRIMWEDLPERRDATGAATEPPDPYRAIIDEISNDKA